MSALAHRASPAEPTASTVPAPAGRRRRVYRVLGRDVALGASLVVGQRSAPVALLDICATGAGLFVPRAACQLLARAVGDGGAGLRLRLVGLAGGGMLMLDVRVVGRRVDPRGVRLSVSFVVASADRAVLETRLRVALNERGAVRVCPPEGAPVRAEVWLPDGRRLAGGLRDASVVGLGIEVTAGAPPVVGDSVVARAWLGGGPPAQVQAAVARVTAVFDDGRETLSGRWRLGLCFAPDGEAVCRGGMVISRYVIRLQLGATRGRG